MEFTPINTQEELNAIISKRIGEEKSRNEKKYADYISPDAYEEKTAEMQKQIADLQASLKEASEKAIANDSLIAERDAKIKQYEIGSVKTRIAAEMGFSFDAIDFLQGENEEEIKKSADALKNLIGIRTAPLANGEGTNVNSEQAALKSMLNNLI